MPRLPCLVLVALTACAGIGSSGTGRGDDDSTGGGGGGAVDASTGAAMSDAAGHRWIDAGAAANDATAVACVEPQTGYGTGEHNTGKNCLDSCHNHGFTVAGTLYSGAANNSAYAGATVTLVDANGTSYPLVVQANGNFYTSANVAFPLTVTASACPYTTPMVAKVTAGGCNVAGCHAQTGGTQMHLP